MSSPVFSISPAQDWKGNDGNWTTFVIQVGTPPNIVTVLPATLGRSIWVVAPGGCEAATDPSSCDTARGPLFDPSSSETWRNVSDAAVPYFYLDFGPEYPLNTLIPEGPQEITYTGAALPGTDRVAFGTNGDDAPELIAQLVASYYPKIPYLGVFGLSVVNETILSREDIHPSPLGAWTSAGNVSSPYWGYTAGARYREGSYNLGSLTFGGYDASRGNVNDVVTVPLSQEDTNRTLLVTIQDISLNSATQNQSVEMQPIQALLDSVVPEIWLPEAICTAFEDAFQLVWNETVEMYLVDDVLNEQLMQRNASVTFVLAADGTTTNTTSITLPYGALQPTAGYPLLQTLTNDTSQTLRYFPLRRAQSDDQIYIGRTFLQEAYLAVDYDKQELYISPATFNPTYLDDLRTPADARSGSGNDTVVVPDNSKISGGAIGGIVIGAVALLSIAAGLIWWFCWRKRAGKKSHKSERTSSIGGTTIEAWNEDVQPEQVEHYKPLPAAELHGEEQDQFRSELDAMTTARGVLHRRELSAGTVRRTSEQSSIRHELSSGTVRRASDQSRASVSPLEERTRRGHTRSDSYGVPSPPSAGRHSPSFGLSDQPSPPLSDSQGQPSPPMSEARGWLAGPVPMFELHGRSRNSPASPATPVAEPQPEATAYQSTLSRLEGTDG